MVHSKKKEEKWVENEKKNNVSEIKYSFKLNNLFQIKEEEEEIYQVKKTRTLSFYFYWTQIKEREKECDVLKKKEV